MATDPSVSPIAFRIACVIGCHFNRVSGETFISQKTIAILINKAERTVRTAIAELERLGYLEVVRRELGTRASDGRRVCGGKGAANVYRPAFERERLNATIHGRRLLLAVEQRLVPAKEETNYRHSPAQRRKNPTTKEEPGVLPTLKPNPINAGQVVCDLGDLADYLRVHIGDVQFRSWFRDVRIKGMASDALRLSVPSELVKHRLLEHYREAIITGWQRMHSRRVVHLEITVTSLRPVS